MDSLDDYHRKWLSLGVPPTQSQLGFTVMTYNVLAQSLIKRTWYPYCQKEVLTMKHRQHRLMKEVAYYLPDVLCMQEVDYYEEWYQPHLNQLGYTTTYVKSDTKRHGCLIAFKHELFDMVDHKLVHLDDMSQVSSGNMDYATGNIAQLMRLQLKHSPNYEFIVTNCHLYWRPTHNYVKLLQVLYLLQQINSFRQDRSTEEKVKDVPIVACGDFNFTPNTPVYSICVQGSRPDSVPDGLEKPPPTDIIDAIEGTDEMKQKIKKLVFRAFVDVDETSWNEDINRVIRQFDTLPKMSSIYSNYTSVDSSHLTETGEPEYTNFCHSFKGTLDYVFLIRTRSSSGKTLKLLPSHLLSIPDEMFLSRHIALPNDIFGSDHISLMTKLYFINS